MKKNKQDISYIKKLFKVRGVQVVTCLALLAIGVASWSVYNKPSFSEDKTYFESSSQNKSNQDLNESVAENAGKTLKGEKDDRVVSSEKSKTTESQLEQSSLESIAAAYFVLPVTGNIVKDFSSDKLVYSETFCDMRIHPGIDIAAAVDTRVTSCGDGVVSDIIQDPLLGTTVVIDHGNNVIARYCGLNKQPTVSKGDVVDSTTQIGTVSQIPSESVEASHLHLEFLVNDCYVSPLKVMGLE